MDIKRSPYNPLDYLETKEEINEYLNTAFMDEDPQVFMIALGHLAKKKGMQIVAQETGLNRESLYKALSSEGNPKFTTIKKVIKALDFKLTVTS